MPALEQGVYALIEDKLIDVLDSDAQLATEVKKFEAGPRGDLYDYISDTEVPTIIAECAVGGGTATPIATGGIFECAYPFYVVTIVEGADFRTRYRKLKDFGDRIEFVLRAQWGANQLGNLDNLVPRAVQGSVVVEVEDTTIEDQSDQEHSVSRSASFTRGTLRIDRRTS